MNRDKLIALVMMNCPLGRVSDNLEKTEYFTRKASLKGADIVCFPELSITGYSTGNEIADHSIKMDGNELGRLVKLSDREKITILTGAAIIHSDGKRRATHLVISPGALVRYYSKIHVHPKERSVFSRGGKVKVFNKDGLLFGVQLCYDVHFPELSTMMAGAGAGLIFLPHASPRGEPGQKLDSWMRHLTARAFDNGVYVAAVNQQGPNGKGLDFPGVAVVIGPDGKVIEKADGGAEGVLYTLLSAEKLARVREHSMGYFFPNRRPEIYSRPTVLENLEDE